MENIYKIKVRTNPDPRLLYPSERRYSASTVLGLGVVHLALAFTALLLASLNLIANKDEFAIANNTLASANSTIVTTALHNEEVVLIQKEDNENLSGAMENNVKNNTQQFDEGNDYNPRVNSNRYSDPYTFVILGPCIMALGSLAAGLTAILAWKRWYIDHNITWFFSVSLLSSATSLLCLILVAVTLIETNEQVHSKPNLRSVIAINVVIASILTFIWSLLASKIAFKGMKNSYPDDLMICKSGGVQVRTIHKGNRKGKISPSDILSHFPVSGKIAKYFPKKDSGNLPKDESNSEYRERVNKFLSSLVEEDISK